MMIDATDGRIMGLLMENARMPLTKIAKAARISQETAGYRLKRMFASGIITSAHPVLNTDLLGLQHYNVFIQFIRSTDEQEQRFLEDLKQYNVFWANKLAGKWSLLFDLYVPTQMKLAATIQKLLEKWGTIIGDYAALAVERKGYYFKKIHGGIHEPRPKGTEPISLDSIDHQLLKLLSANARASYAELTSQVKLTANAVKHRIKQLEKTGVIIGYTILVDYRKLGYEGYGIQVQLLNHQPGQVKKIFSWFREQDRLAIIHQYIPGPWDFEFRIIVENSTELRTFISELNNRFANDIRFCDFYLVLEEIVL